MEEKVLIMENKQRKTDVCKEKNKQKQMKRMNKGKLNSKEKKAIGIHHAPESIYVYQDYLALHHLWLQYILDVLVMTNGAVVTPKDNPLNSNSEVYLKLRKADFHGAIVTGIIRHLCFNNEMSNASLSRAIQEPN
jgi:ribonuclease P protein subunit POP4